MSGHWLRLTISVQVNQQVTYAKELKVTIKVTLICELPNPAAQTLRLGIWKSSGQKVITVTGSHHFARSLIQSFSPPMTSIAD